MTTMKNKYEAVIVLNAQGKEESVEAMVGAIGKEIEGLGARLEKVENLGRKQFAYNARHVDGGYYVNYTFEAEGDAIEQIQSTLKLNDDVHLQFYKRL
ncbi:MAG: 30S ribosomal protein S6 [Verrucomicrobiota bacterium]